MNESASMLCHVLTKREYYAGLAMNALLTKSKKQAIDDLIMSGGGYSNFQDFIAEHSVALADALIEKLDKEK